MKPAWPVTLADMRAGYRFTERRGAGMPEPYLAWTVRSHSASGGAVTRTAEVVQDGGAHVGQVLEAGRVAQPP